VPVASSGSDVAPANSTAPAHVRPNPVFPAKMSA
jgi:hypothetical protein